MFSAGSGDGMMLCIDVSIMEDLLVEGTELFSIKISLVASGQGVTIGMSETIVAITDADGQKSFSCFIVGLKLAFFPCRCHCFFATGC